MIKDIKEKELKKPISFGRYTFFLLLLLMFASVGYVYIANPKLAGAIKVYLNNKSELENEVFMLKSDLEALKIKQVKLDAINLDKLDEKIVNIEKLHINTIDSKADVKTVLGLVNRMDRTENKVNNMAKVTDESALVLTATVLVKDAASRGGDFIYEAEVLQQLASGHTFKEPVSVIVKHSKSGIYTKSYLINDFESIYKSLLKKQKVEVEKNWKDRLNSKLNEFIQVKKVNKEEAVQKADDLLFTTAKNLVVSGDFSKAIKIIAQIKDAVVADDESLKIWVVNAKNYDEFSSAISRISASSLAIMKVNFIKRETNND